MYLNFYQLCKKPFSLAPDPAFLYLSQQHKDALGAIIYGIQEREGFVSVVGEVGTGKTTIVRSYLQKVGRKQILPIFIFNSRITFAELMKAFLEEIGIDSESTQQSHNVNDMVKLAYPAMIEKTRQGKNIVLIIDEAQNMPIETLGNLCTLSNFETSKAKLIQIILVGQPELQKKLDLYELRQLRQRIAYRARIKPLSLNESIRYLHHRLSLSSIKQKPIFTTSAIRLIVKHSKGVPRVINILCENSLVAGYGLQKKTVSLKIVKQVIAEYEGNDFSSPFQFKNVAASILVLLTTALLLISYAPHLSSPEEAIGNEVNLEHTSKPHLQPTESKVRAILSSKEPVPQVERVVSVPERDELSTKPFDDSRSPKTSVEAPQPQSSDTLVTTLLPEVSREPLTTSFEGSLETEKSLQEIVESIMALLERHKFHPKQSSRYKIAKRGDTVSKLCLETYGFVDEQTLVWIKTHNPHIHNMDEIQIDEVVFFPEIETLNSPQTLQRANNRTNPKREEVVSR